MRKDLLDDMNLAQKVSNLKQSNFEIYEILKISFEIFFQVNGQLINMELQ